MKVDSPEKESMKLAKIYLEDKYGRDKVENVSRKGGKFAGYDFLCNKKIKIEVKGTTRFQGIPDPYITEFEEENKKMIADYMYIFYFPRDKEEKMYGSKVILYIVKKADFKSSDLSPKFGWRISSKFKKNLHHFKDKKFSV